MAHRESNEREGEAGNALWPANQATTAVGAEEEDVSLDIIKIFIVLINLDIGI